MNQIKEFCPINNTSDAKKLWKSFSEENKDINTQATDKVTNLKFSLHNKDFNLSIKINFKNILTTEQKIASLLVIVLPAVILIIVTILALNPATSSMPLALIVIPIFILLFGGGLTAGYFITKKPKKNN